MSGKTSPNPQRILHLVVEGFPAARREEIAVALPGTTDLTEVFELTEANAAEALGKIFAADTIAVWGKL